MPRSRFTSYDEDPDAEGSVARETRAPAWAEEHLGVLRDLRDMGMTLARSLTRQVVAEADEAPGGEVAEAPRRGMPVDPALSFSRISRAVRLTLALEARVHQTIEGAVKDRPANDDRSEDGAVGPIDYAAIKRQLRPPIDGKADYEVRRAVEETIEADCDDPDHVERLKEDLAERLEEDEAFAYRGNWSIGEAVALICQDLGLTPDWDRWEKRGWARREAEESPPGSPYATVERPPDPHCRSGTQMYREARGLPP